ncbi:hypothetical protein K438DRAFT_1768900 [Mycena galopus ATCC 62051]|nr:hypothetical protein K438DRAFT_1768900 [Mycena galopus ATCC 62051]
MKAKPRPQSKNQLKSPTKPSARVRRRFENHAKVTRKRRQPFAQWQIIIIVKGDELSAYLIQMHPLCWLTQHHRKYKAANGIPSYLDIYQPLLEFFGEGTLAGVTIVDQTVRPRKKKFSLPITEEFEAAKQKFLDGKRVKLIITDKSIGMRQRRLLIPCYLVGGSQQGPRASLLRLASPPEFLFFDCLTGYIQMTQKHGKPHPSQPTGHQACQPRFYASKNFDGYAFHDAQPQRRYYVVLVGVSAAIYSVKSAAEKALPDGNGTFYIRQCDTIRDACLHWRRWCLTHHWGTCNLAALARLPAVDDQDDSDPEVLSDDKGTRCINVVMRDLHPDDENVHVTIPIVRPIDTAACRHLKLNMDGTPWSEHKVSVTLSRREVKREPTPKRRRRLHRDPSPSPPPLTVSLWADGTPPNSVPAPGPSITSRSTAFSSASAAGRSTAQERGPPMSPSVTSASSLTQSPFSNLGGMVGTPNLSLSSAPGPDLSLSSAPGPSMAARTASPSAAARAPGHTTSAAARNFSGPSGAAHTTGPTGSRSASPTPVLRQFWINLRTQAIYQNMHLAMDAMSDDGEVVPFSSSGASPAPVSGEFWFNRTTHAIYRNMHIAMDAMGDDGEVVPISSSVEVEDEIRSASRSKAKAKSKGKTRQEDINMG